MRRVFELTHALRKLVLVNCAALTLPAVHFGCAVIEISFVFG